MVGSSSNDIRQVVKVYINGRDFGTLNLTNSTNIFDHAVAASDVYYLEYSKVVTLEGLQNNELAYGQYVVVGNRPDGWVAMNDVNLTGVASLTANVAYAGEGFVSKNKSGSELKMVHSFCSAPSMGAILRVKVPSLP